MPSAQSIEIPLADTNQSRPERPSPPVSEEDLSGLVLSRRYELLRLLGRGGMGAVYLGRHVALERRFAIKVLNRRYSSEKHAIQRFIGEARATAQLRHENVVDVYDFGISQGWFYLVMEHLEGEDLAAALRRDGPMPWHRVSRILLQVCAALQAAHRRRIVHRDIKPSNCFRVFSDVQEDLIKVLDFGVAKVLGGGTDERGGLETDTQMVIGTPEYMAPEGFSGGPIDGRVDVYAVGMLGYHLLTCKLPFVRSSSDFLQRVCTGVVRSPRQAAPRAKIPALADEILMRALRPLASERFQTISELGAAIAAAIEPPSVVTAPPPSSGSVTVLGPSGDAEEETTRRHVAVDAALRPWRTMLVSSGVAAVLAVTLKPQGESTAELPAAAPTVAIAADKVVMTPPEEVVEDEHERLELPPHGLVDPPPDAPWADVSASTPPARQASARPAARSSARPAALPVAPAPASAVVSAQIPMSVPAEPLWAPESVAPRRSDMLRPDEGAEEEKTT